MFSLERSIYVSIETCVDAIRVGSDDHSKAADILVCKLAPLESEVI